MKKIIIIAILLAIVSGVVIAHNLLNKKVEIVVETAPKVIPQTANAMFSDTKFDYTDVKNNKALRNSFKQKYKGTDCGSFNEPDCLKDMNFGDNKKISHAGLILDDGSVMLFHYDYNNHYGATGKEKGYGQIFYDANGDAKPNNICEDRFVYNIFENRVSLDIMLPCTNTNEPMPFLE